MKPDRKKWPQLAAAWDAYGHSKRWEDLFDIKSDGSYACLAWMEGQVVVYADLAWDGETWQWQNDSCHQDPPLTVARWRTGRIVPDCDTIVFKGEET